MALMTCPICKREIDSINVTIFGAMLTQEITDDGVGDPQWSYPDIVNFTEIEHRCPKCSNLFKLKKTESMMEFINRHK